MAQDSSIVPIEGKNDNKVRYVNGKPISIIEVPTFADDPFAFIDDYALDLDYKKTGDTDSSNTIDMVPMVNRSTEGKPAKAVEITRSVNYDTIINRVKKFGVVCLVAGCIAVSTVMINSFHQNSVITPHVMSFQECYVHPNTHRTSDNQHYYYDYEQIAAYLKAENVDFSRRLYVAVDALGENQVNKVLDYVPGVSSVEDYVEESGFEDVDAWKKHEVGKFMLEHKIEEQRARLRGKSDRIDGMQKDLDSMYSDYRTSINGSGNDYNNGGVNK